MNPQNNPIKRAANRPTYLNAIKAKCAECVGCTLTHLEEGFRRSISACTSTTCPLHRYRPYQASEKAGTRETSELITTDAGGA